MRKKSYNRILLGPAGPLMTKISSTNIDFSSLLDNKRIGLSLIVNARPLAFPARVY